MKLILLSFAIMLLESSGGYWLTSNNVCQAIRPDKYIGISFDAFGTLLDISSVPTRRAKSFKLSEDFTKLWREKQISYTWRRTIMGRYKNFWEVTKDALDYSLEFHNRSLTSQEKKHLLHSWYHLESFSDVKRGLERLKASGYQLYIFSNGTPNMLQKVLETSGIRQYFTDVLSVDDLKEFKPSPKVYTLLESYTGIPKNKNLFVSSNSWDAAGAKSCGYNTVWLNRTREPVDTLEFPPSYTFANLVELAKAFQ